MHDYDTGHDVIVEFAERDAAIAHALQQAELLQAQHGGSYELDITIRRTVACCADSRPSAIASVYVYAADAA
ncbi:MAG: hypothetical protein AB7Q01_08605 [Gammaproteobacteria bacterium]